MVTRIHKSTKFLDNKCVYVGILFCTTRECLGFNNWSYVVQYNTFYECKCRYTVGIRQLAARMQNKWIKQIIINDLVCNVRLYRCYVMSLFFQSAKLKTINEC